MEDRDGFIIRKRDTNEEIDFVPCAQSGRARDQAISGLVRKTDMDRFYVVDTRMTARPQEVRQAVDRNRTKRGE